MNKEDYSKEKYKILFVAGSTKSSDTNLEHRKIEERIRASDYRDNFAMKATLAATIEGIIKDMAGYAPTIFHFTGHGTPDYLQITKEDNSVQPLPNAALKRLFGQYIGRIKVVIFNACESSTQAELVSGLLEGYAIGMNKPIREDAAIAFLNGFYLGLGAGKTVENAFEDGLTVLETKFSEAVDIPELWRNRERVSGIPPEKAELFLYVIASHAPKVKKTIGDDLYALLPPDRYHETDNRAWRPFQEQPTIEAILSDFRKQEGYLFQERYIDEEPEEEDVECIYDQKNKMIVVIDALSLCETNKLTSKGFDNTEMGGLLCPRCRKLPDSVHTKIGELISTVFSNYKRLKKVRNSRLLEKNISDIEEFYEKLSYFCSSIVPLKSHSTYNNPKRGLPNSSFL